MRLHLDLACVKLSDTQAQLRKLEEKVNDIEKNIQCSVENSNSFTWKIGSFREALRKAKSGEKKTPLYSSPFYKFGYKCKLGLDPNGFDNGKGTHMSICMIIMKGENDAALTWPFHKKVTIRLIDQQENALDRRDIAFSFTETPDPTSCTVRPINDENPAFGLPQFVSHEKIQKRRYIVDDTIFIQVEISAPE